jgi:hypothetical protein
MKIEALGYLALAFVITLCAGMAIGRFACCPKPQSFSTTHTPVQHPSPQGGVGIMQPEPSQPHVAISGTSTQTLALGASWHRFEDKYITIRVRAQNADTINYTFKKSWHEFTPADPYVQSLFIYGVAPESVKINGQATPMKKASPFAFDAYALLYHDLGFDAIAILTYKRFGVAANVGTEKLEFSNRDELKFRARAAIAVKIF